MDKKLIKQALEYVDKRINKLGDKIVEAISKNKPNLTVEKTQVDIDPLIVGLDDVREAVTKIKIPKVESNIELLQLILEEIKSNRPEQLAEKFDALDVVFKGLKPKDTVKFDETQVKGIMAALTNGGGINTTGGMTLEEYEAKTDELIAAVNGISGTGIYIKSWDEVGPLTYIGEAVVGTPTSSALWRIKRIDETNDPDGDIRWASTSFNQVWDNRASLSYS